MADGIVFTDAQIWYESGDLSGYSNQIAWEGRRTQLERSAFGSAWKQRCAGAAEIAASADVFWIVDPVDNLLWPETGSAGVLTVAEANTAGEDAWMMAAAQLDFGLGGQWGELAKASPRWVSDGIAAEGIVSAAKADRTANGNGTGAQLGAVASGSAVVATVHVFSISASTLTVIIESDDNAGFASATTRITQGSITTAGAYHLTDTTVVTDDYWRARWTYTGGTANFAVCVGVVPLS